MDGRQDPNPDPPNPNDEASDLPYKKRSLKQEPAAVNEHEDDVAVNDDEDEVAADDTANNNISKDDAAADARMRRKMRKNILENKRMTLEELQREAYFSVVRAFKAESRGFSRTQAMILKQLSKEFKIAYKQHQILEKVINEDTLIQKLRGDKPQIGQEAPAREVKLPHILIKLKQGICVSKGEVPLPAQPEDKDKKMTTSSSPENMPSSLSSSSTYKEKKMTTSSSPGKTPSSPSSSSADKDKEMTTFSSPGKMPSSSSADKGKEVAAPSSPGRTSLSSSPSSAGGSSRESWGKISPESLVGRSVFVRLPGDDEFVEFIIRKYDAEQEMHSLETPEDTMEDPCSWVDLRDIPTEDIMWEGEDPGIHHEDEGIPQQGLTIIHETSTTGRERADDCLFKVPPPFMKGDNQEQTDAGGDSSLQTEEQPKPHGTNTKGGKPDDGEGNIATR